MTQDQKRRPEENEVTDKFMSYTTNAAGNRVLRGLTEEETEFCLAHQRAYRPGNAITKGRSDILTSGRSTRMSGYRPLAHRSRSTHLSRLSINGVDEPPAGARVLSGNWFIGGPPGPAGGLVADRRCNLDRRRALLIENRKTEHY